jgi:hypothetical protein
MPPQAWVVTTLTWKDLTFETPLAVPVATMQFAVASEQRDGVAFLYGEIDRMSELFNALFREASKATSL